MSEQPTKPTAGTYSVEMRCSNCGATRKMAFSCGKEVPRKVDCPVCNCWTMSKTYFDDKGSGLAECMDVFFNGRAAK